MAQLRSHLITWIILSVLTVASYAVGRTHHSALPVLASSAIVVVACVKARIIAWNFMELREAVLPLRLAIDVWLVGIGTILIGFFALAH